MEDLKVGIEGLAQVNRALRSIDKEAPKELRLSLNAAANLLIDRARPKIPQVSGAARRSLVAQSTRTSARVAAGGKKAPYYPWVSFGGQGRIAGRPPARPFIKEGRDIYPTLREIRPQIEAHLQDSLTAVIRKAGLEPS
jgi:hypothetical protein